MKWSHKAKELVFSDGLFLSVDNTGRKRVVLIMRRVSYSDTKYRVRILRIHYAINFNNDRLEFSPFLVFS